ncbi:hypothetical protein NX794_27665 [Streptomyces sp. LP11]|uniref:RNA polymerase sigma factor 70 region 4 type 2 domain-containing protein n=1 Tax=Streptomyces pyxinicus TaxID=2970331 RepID=A0ABT2B8W7_9ACTN|nr:hypothetical protein [Streptomyces sp. LP11]MCS0604959.1 hypothetical protein [Streptomyces sp. LP11]
MIDSLYQTCVPDVADVVLLRYRLGLSPNAVADVMGVDHHFVAAGLQAAIRLLPRQALEHLEEVVPRS